MGLFQITESIEDAVDHILRFYRVYNSSRYVRGRLVLRLNHELTEGAPRFRASASVSSQ